MNQNKIHSKMKTHTLHFFLFLELLILIQSSSCSNKNKNEEETVCTTQNTVLVPQDLKDRFFFKEGTYWIYKNIASNETDSLWVVLGNVETISVDNKNYGYIKNKCYERFVTTVKNKQFNNDLYYNVYAIIIHPKEGIGGAELFG